MSYQMYVGQIKRLHWEKLTIDSATWLMILSRTSALEFAGGVKAALETYPDDPRIKAMAAGELQTDNLNDPDYTKIGDHWEYLDNYLLGIPHPEPIVKACDHYYKIVTALPPKDWAHTVLSREKELPGIFSAIRNAPVWTLPLPLHLRKYTHYLKRHIDIDSGEGGHYDLVKHYGIGEEVAAFYEARLKLYTEAIPELQS